MNKLTYPIREALADWWRDSALNTLDGAPDSESAAASILRALREAGFIPLPIGIVPHKVLRENGPEIEDLAGRDWFHRKAAFRKEQRRKIDRRHGRRKSKNVAQMDLTSQ